MSDDSVRIVKGGKIGEAERALPQTWSPDVAWFTYGGPTDLWGAQWTAVDIKDDRSGLGIEQVKGKYSYVRAHEIAKDRIEFTLFVVGADDHAVLRALISADPARLDGAPMSKRVTWRSFESHWVERNADVGKHEGGAAPRSIDSLYDDCANLIRQHPSAPVRLFFHPDGVH